MRKKMLKSFSLVTKWASFVLHKYATTKAVLDFHGTTMNMFIIWLGRQSALKVLHHYSCDCYTAVVGPLRILVSWNSTTYKYTYTLLKMKRILLVTAWHLKNMNITNSDKIVLALVLWLKWSRYFAVFEFHGIQQ